MQSLKLPDITPAQFVAVIGSILAVLVAAGLDISKDLQDSIIQLVTVLSGFLLAGDAVIRHGRSRALQNPPKGTVNADESGATTTGPGA